VQHPARMTLPSKQDAHQRFDQTLNIGG